MYKYILNSEYAVTVKKTCSYNILSGVNGIVDTVRTLLTDYDIHNRAILQNLLFAFQYYFKLIGSLMFTACQNVITYSLILIHTFIIKTLFYHVISPVEVLKYLILSYLNMQ